MTLQSLDRRARENDARKSQTAVPERLAAPACFDVGSGCKLVLRAALDDFRLAAEHVSSSGDRSGGTRWHIRSHIGDTICGNADPSRYGWRALTHLQ